MTVDIWQQRGAVLAREHRLQQFEIADWLLLGIEQYGATSAYDYAETLFPQYARATFQSWVTVAKHFPASMRIESDWLTFSHYQVAQGAEYSSAEAKELQAARELVWLRKADEHRMSVSALRDDITNAYRLLHPDPTTVPVDEPEPDPEPKKAVKRNIFGKQIKEFETPWLPKQARFHIDELARARHVTTEQLLQRVIQDFLDAHNDEIGNAELAAKKRAAEHDAALDAAAAAEELERQLVRFYKLFPGHSYDEAPTLFAERERQQQAEREQAAIEADLFGTESVVKVIA
jgi:hypothetical protein